MDNEWYKRHVEIVESLVNYKSDFELKQEEKLKRLRKQVEKKHKGGENNAD